MNTKLTLTIEKAVIERAKKYAKSSGRSLSDMIESYLERLTANENEVVPVEFKDLFGSVDLPDDFDDKKAIREIMSEKHK